MGARALKMNEDFKFQDTSALKQIFKLKKRIRALAGGTSACKTIGILVWLIDYGQSTQSKVMTVVAESVPHLMLGAIRDFKNIMTSNGYWMKNGGTWNESSHIYKFGGGSMLEFISFDKFGKAHGPRRDILFLNEANNIPWNIADQLITRTREIVWLDWNPSEEFWFYTEMKPMRDDIDFITLTYLDNEALDEVSKNEILSHRNNKSWWRVYGEGLLGEIESRIYRNWALIDEIPHEARLWRRGIDFGYTNDPTAIGAGYEYNGGFIIDEEVYQKGLSNKSIFDIVNNLPESQILAIGDSAEPKSIDELTSYGMNIIGATKGPGSVYQGIQFVQAQKISITRRSFNFLKAYRNYNFKTDKNGIIINVPDDSNHEWSNAMDSVWYMFNGVGSDSKVRERQRERFEEMTYRIKQESCK